MISAVPNFTCDCALAAVDSPLEGEAGSRAGARAWRGITPAESNRHPPPHPSPSRGEGAACRSLGVKYDNPALKGGGRRKLLARSHAAPALFGGCGLNPARLRHEAIQGVTLRSRKPQAELGAAP